MEDNKVPHKLVRFNVNQAIDKYAWDIISSLDKAKHKSANNYIVKAIIAYDEMQKRPPLTEEHIIELVEKTVRESVHVSVSESISNEMGQYMERLAKIGIRVEDPEPEIIGDDGILEDESGTDELDAEVLSFISDLKLD